MLVIFQKYYNKRFVSLQEQLRWSRNKKKEDLKKTRVLTRSEEKTGNTLRDVKLEKVSIWGPWHVFVVKGLDELFGVKGDLEDM